MFHGKQFNAPPACFRSGWAARRFLQVRLQWIYAEAEDEDTPPSHGGGKPKEVR